MTDTTNTDWIEWAGGECPVPYHEIVEVRFDDNIESGGVSAGFWAGDGTPHDPCCWKHENGDGYHIIAYRIVKP